MDLVLDREYWPGGTNGALLLDGKTLCQCMEPPAAYFRADTACIPEGIYELDLISDTPMQRISLFRCPNGIRSDMPTEVEICTRQLQRNIVLVSEITGEGRGVPCQKAWTNLLHLIGQTLQRGEKATLEIRSYPEHARNPDFVLGFVMRDKITRKSDCLETEAWHRHGSVENCNAASDFEIILGRNRNANA